MKRLLPLLIFTIIVYLVGAPTIAQQIDRELSPNDPNFVAPIPESSGGTPYIQSYSGGPTLASVIDTCECLDIVFVIDDTGSMGPAINNVKAGITSILILAEATCDSVQAGLITFKDNVEVDVDLTTNLAAVQAAILALVATGGLNEPEASNEALREAVTAAGTTCPKIGDFTFSSWRDGCCKIAILVTDARPGTCDDAYVVGVDDIDANAVAVAAVGNNIKIGAIYTETFLGFSGTIIPIMLNYAAVTGGVYGQTPADGSGTADAIEQIILDCVGTAATELCCTVIGCTSVIQGSCVPSGGFVISNCAECTVEVHEKTWGAIKALYKND